MTVVTDSVPDRSEQPEPPEQEDAAGETAPLLVADQVTVGFGGLLALDEVSMSVGHGEVVGVIGPNGAGKTTLFNVISGFVHPSSGTITYRGTVLRRHHPHDLAKLGIARTLQGIGLCPGLTVHENVMLGAEPTLRSDLGSAFLGIWRSSREERRVAARAMAVLEELGAADYARRMPAALPYAFRSGPRWPAPSWRSRGSCCSTSRRAGCPRARWTRWDRGSACSPIACPCSWWSITWTW